MTDGDFDDLAHGTPATDSRPEPETAADWRDDPAWRIVSYESGLWSEADAPNRPTDEAELANPPIWASLYECGRIVATWGRPRASDLPSDHSATVAA